MMTLALLNSVVFWVLRSRMHMATSRQAPCYGIG
jgi:hypothetical protein